MSSKFAIKFSGKSLAIKHAAVHRCTFMKRLRIRLNLVAKETSKQSYIHISQNKKTLAITSLYSLESRLLLF